MIRIRQLKIPVFDKQDLDNYVCQKLNISSNQIKQIMIIKKSIDARKKPNLFYVYEINVEVENETELMRNNKDKDILKVQDEDFHYELTGTEILNSNPVIVGAGPAGLFCGYILSKYGYKPLIIEQGEAMEKRIETVENFFQTGILNETSNVQFGEGGAGTFSDGKLNTNAKDKNHLQKEVLKIFIECGAPKEIMYINKPHIGTDLLQKVIINMRNKIIDMGGVFRFNTKLTNVIYKDGCINQIEVNNSELINTKVLVLAIGHSARDTFKMLNDNKLAMVSKPFAVGFRVQHDQKKININQYGVDDPRLPMADYKLTYNSNSRGVYSFCMCPGGYVVNSSSELNKLVINGMSNHLRDSGVANSAIIITVGPDDYGSELFDGIKFQEQLEQKAYNLLSGKIPTQLYGDFKKNVISTEFKSIKPCVKGIYDFANLRDILPRYLTNTFIDGMTDFGKKINGFDNDDVILMGIESRTSSPIRIIRNDCLESNITGIYPAGEGAGYAGGIMTSSVDGIKVAQEILKKYKV